MSDILCFAMGNDIFGAEKQNMLHVYVHHKISHFIQVVLLETG